jgi:hypothetical protein
MMSSFVEDGRFSSQWRVELSPGPRIIVSALRLSLSPPSPAHPIAQVRAMEGAGSSTSAAFYRLPKSLGLAGGLKSGESHVFEYVVRGTAPAIVALVSVSCAASEADHSSSSLPFYAGPWFSFFNKNNKNEIVNEKVTDEAPPGKSNKCVIKVEQLGRALEEGGSWTDGGFVYRTYDLKITNLGQQPYTWSLIKVLVAPNEELYEVRPPPGHCTN